MHKNHFSPYHKMPHLLIAESEKDRGWVWLTVKQEQTVKLAHSSQQNEGKDLLGRSQLTAAVLIDPEQSGNAWFCLELPQRKKHSFRHLWTDSYFLSKGQDSLKQHTHILCISAWIETVPVNPLSLCRQDEGTLAVSSWMRKYSSEVTFGTSSSENGTRHKSKILNIYMYIEPKSICKWHDSLLRIKPLKGQFVTELVYYSNFDCNIWNGKTTSRKKFSL